MVRDTASQMAETKQSILPARAVDRLTNRWRLSLTSRILVVNILPLALLGGGIFYLDSYRTQLLTERYKLARIEAQTTAVGADRQRTAHAAAHVRFRRTPVG